MKRRGIPETLLHFSLAVDVELCKIVRRINARKGVRARRKASDSEASERESERNFARPLPQIGGRKKRDGGDRHSIRSLGKEKGRRKAGGAELAAAAAMMKLSIEAAAAEARKSANEREHSCGERSDEKLQGFCG